MNNRPMTFLVTGGAGFIGSAVIRQLLANTEHHVVNMDALTYAGNLESLPNATNNPRYHFEQVDICNAAEVERVFKQHQPDIVMHLAAESHVDRSIEGPEAFIKTNLFGTYNLLESSRRHWDKQPTDRKQQFRFHHVSTDEVYGDLHGTDDLFTEETPYDPSSPYSASKAGSDHLVRAWGRTYGLPYVVTNCSNNYGPYQFPEKLIPHMILNALAGKPLPVYGNGQQVRDWLHVDDHADALLTVATRGENAETYNIGGHNEQTNLTVVETICTLLQELVPKERNYADLIQFVNDRPGHDVRYAIDASKIEHQLGWTPRETFDSGLRKTVEWYLHNQAWWQRVLSGEYQLERRGISNQS